MWVLAAVGFGSKSTRVCSFLLLFTSCCDSRSCFPKKLGLIPIILGWNHRNRRLLDLQHVIVPSFTTESLKPAH